jgi:hypothetical protein
MREITTPTGCLHILVRDREGRVVERRRVENLVTTAGRTLLARLLSGLERVVRIDLEVGGAKELADADQDIAQPRSADVALAQRLTAVSTTLGVMRERPGASANDPTRWVTEISATLPAGGDPLFLREAGLRVFTSASDDEGGEASVLYNRVVFERISKQPSLEMSLTWEVVF